MSSTPALEDVRCNLCGNEDIDVLLEALPSDPGKTQKRYAASGDSPLADRLVRCRHCRLVYVSPRPHQKSIESGYEEVDNSVYLAQGEARLKTFRRAVAWLAAQGVAKGRLLDVGCAGGFFVKAAQEAGWKAEGIEISRHLCEYGRQTLGITVTQGTLDRFTGNEGSYDLISFWDVLEHVADPMEALRRSRKLLKSGGSLLINYPNYDSFWAKSLGRHWWFLIDVHIYYFTPKLLKAMLQKAGFAVTAERRHFQDLPLGYVLERVQGMFPKIGGVLSALCRLLHVDRRTITYYASQKSMLAKVQDVQK